jgi:DNA-binding transcriptional regulator LsrR (DeoR family)
LPAIDQLPKMDCAQRQVVSPADITGAIKRRIINGLITDELTADALLAAG